MEVCVEFGTEFFKVNVSQLCVCLALFTVYFVKGDSSSALFFLMIPQVL